MGLYMSHVNTVSSVQSLSSVASVRLFATAAHKASLSITNSRSLLKLMSIKPVMPSNHLILYHPLLLPPSIFLSIRVFSYESVIGIRWPKYWSCSFSISTSNTRYQTNLSLSERGGGAGGEIMAAVTINCP